MLFLRTMRNVLPVVCLLALVTTVSAQTRMRMGGAAAALQFPEDREVVEVPFEYLRGKIVIPVRVNGSEPLPFVLDTGAPIAVLIDSELGETLDLDIMGKAMVGGAGEGETKSVPIAGNITFDVGGIEVTGLSMAVGIGGHMMKGMTWKGVIGQPLFRDLVVDIDFIDHIIKFYPPDRYTYQGNGSTVPLDVSSMGFAFVDGTVDLDGAGEIPVSLVIDIGAGHALSLQVGSHEDLQVPETALPNAILGWGANGVIRGRIGRINRLAIGGYAMDGVVVSFPDPSSHGVFGQGGREHNAGASSPGLSGRHGNLGTTALERFHVIFDYTHDLMILEPNEEFADPFTFTTTGVQLKPAASGTETIEVIDVIDRSPAAKAGIQAGDKIQAIDGRPVKKFTRDEIRELLSQEPGTKLTLTIQRGSRVIKKKITLKKLI